MNERDIFLAAIERSETDRDEYLNQTCGGDSGLRRRVEALLNSHDGAGSFLGQPLVSPPDSEHAATRAFTPDVEPAKPQVHSDDEAEAMAFLAPAKRPDSLGRIGHYEVLQILGRGGFGIVFRAFDDILQRVVAVKVMTPQLAATSPARKRFQREAESSAAVRHENVVQVYEVGTTPLPYLVMEFIPGETLQQKLDRTGPLDAVETVRIGRQIAEGLAAAHATDLIHRDIKPGNVLIEGGQNRVKITDFGLARAADDASISQSGIIAGTPMYMAPEQALGHKLDQRADLFSLGSVLYQMVSGRPPFRASSTLAVLKRVAEDAPRSIREIVPETPQWLCDIIAKLHAKNPDERYQSAREVADVLADCEEQLKANSKLKDFSRIPAAKPAPTRRRGWRRPVGVAAGVLVLLALAAWAGPTAVDYARNRGELEVLPGDGLVDVIVLRNDDGVLDGNKLHAPATDWLDVKQPRRVSLPPGRYQLNVGTWPSGTEVTQWEVTSSGLFGSTRVTVPVVQTSALVTVDRGQRVTVRPVMRAAPPATPTPASPELPKRTADILSFIRGNWKRDSIVVVPKPGGDSRSFGQLTFDAVANGTVMRGLTVDENGRETSMILHAYDGAKDQIRSWYFSAEGETNASNFGEYDPTSRTLLWFEKFPDGTQSFHKLDFVDANTVRVRNYDTDAAGGKVYESQATFTRTSEPPAAPKSMIDPKRPAEMKVLDQLVGDWRSDITVAIPGPPKKEVEFAKARSCLAGHMIETFATNETAKGNDYSVQWYDGSSKRFCLWAFIGDGQIHDLSGTWDEATKTIALASKDGVLFGHTILKRDDQYEFRRAAKNPVGQIVFDATGVARRVGQPAPTFTNGIGMEFVNVPKGKSWLGGGKDKLGDNPVEIPADFQLGKYEVTQEEWERVMGENPSHFSRSGGGKDAVKDISDADLKRFPVENVSWELCQAFIKKLNEKETGWVYQLPKEAEWEYACRGGPMVDKAGSDFDFHFAKPTNTILLEQANFGFDKGRNRTCKVSSYEANRLGLFDMHGNVWEWCDDTEKAPDGASRHVFRGGGWDNPSTGCRTTVREPNHGPSHQSFNVGLRLARVRSGAPSPRAKAPFADAEVQRIAALPADKQVEEVRKELKRRNPDFDGTLLHVLDGDRVTGIEFLTEKVSDISPVRALVHLTDLNCRGNGVQRGLVSDLSPLRGLMLKKLVISVSEVADLSPLKGMPLTHLFADNTRISDLAPLEGMPLKELNCSYSKVASLAPLKDAPLTVVWCNHTDIADLAPLKGKSLEWITFHSTKVTDIAVLKGMPLTQMYIDYDAKRDREVLRGLTTLTKINDKPAEEFWKDADKK